MPKFTELQDLAITIVIGVLKRAAPCVRSPKQPCSPLLLGPQQYTARGAGRAGSIGYGRGSEPQPMHEDGGGGNGVAAEAHHTLVTTDDVHDGTPLAARAAAKESATAAAAPTVLPSQPVLAWANGIPGSAGVAGGNTAAAGKKQEAPRCACCRSCLLRMRVRLPTIVRGVPLPVLVTMGAALVMPTIDAWSDWLVVLLWYTDGHMGRFKAGLVIQLISGSISGLLLAAPSFCTGKREGKRMLRLANVPLALAFGLVGLAPGVYAAKVLMSRKDPDERRKDSVDVLCPLTAFTRKDSFFGTALSLRVLKALKFLEFALEALPQLVLQSFVGFSYRELDSSAPQFNLALAVSIVISLLGAGASLTHIDFKRDEEVYAMASPFGVVLLLLRASQTAALVFSIGLLGCAQQGGAWVWMVLGGAVNIILHYDTMLRTEPDGGARTIGCQKFCCGCCGACTKEGSMGSGVIWLFALLGGMALMFVYAEPVDNNYLNETAPEGGPDTPQFYDCRDSTTGIVAAATATALCTLLLPLYRLMDPKFGLKSCHTDSWEERVAADEAKLKHEWELGPKTLDWSATLLRAKITAVWRVADSVEDGKLAPEELKLLGNKLGAVPQESPRQIRLVKTNSDHHEFLCEAMNVTPLSRQHSAGFGAAEEYEDATLSQEQFTQRCLTKYGDYELGVVLFNSLQPPLCEADNESCLGALC